MNLEQATIENTVETDNLLIFTINTPDGTSTGYVPKELFFSITPSAKFCPSSKSATMLHFFKTYMYMFDLECVDGKLWSPKLMSAIDEYVSNYAKREPTVDYKRLNYRIDRKIRSINMSGNTLFIDVKSDSSLKNTFMKHRITIKQISDGVELEHAQYYLDKPELKYEIGNYIAKHYGWEDWRFGKLRTKIQILKD